MMPVTIFPVVKGRGRRFGACRKTRHIGKVVVSFDDKEASV